MKYVVVVADNANVEAVKDLLVNLGATTVEHGNLNLLLVDSEVSLNLAAVDGIESYQETSEVQPDGRITGIVD